MLSDLIRILIVDDSLTIRAILDRMIANDPKCAVVGIAPDVDAARSMLARTRPDVITLDLAMPGMNGLEFLDELAKQTHAPVVVVSSSTKDHSEAAAEALAHGAAACFDKAHVVSDAPQFMRVLKKAARRKQQEDVAPPKRYAL
jgi:two-component system chemotaxis response regulator CheB